MDTDTATRNPIETPTGEAVTDDTITKAVLFVDVVASTDFARVHGDQRWRDAVSRHERAVRAIVERHRGVIGSFTGDGFMMLFDEPGDALECALRLSLANDVQQLFDIRMGLEYGSFLPYGAGRFVGLTLHVASRLTDLSGSGEITMSGECHRLAQRTAAIPPTQCKEVAIRGLETPLTVHIVRHDHTA